MRLYLVRHAEKANSEPDYDGGPDPPITERGERQATQLAESLAERPFDGLYSSCQRRALQTAAPVHEHLDCAWHVWPVFCESTNSWWREQYAGDREPEIEPVAWRVGEPMEMPADEDLADETGGYRPLSDLEAAFPDIRLSQPFPWPDAWWRPTKEKTQSMGYARIELGIQALVERHEAGDDIAVVSHGNIIDRMLTMIMDFPRRGQRKRFYTDYTGISRLDRVDDDCWEIQYTNRADHLSS